MEKISKKYRVVIATTYTLDVEGGGGIKSFGITVPCLLTHILTLIK